MDGLGVTPRPALSAMDLAYEEVVESEARTVGAWGVMTGQGGDNTFYSLTSAAVAVDPQLLRRPRRRRAVLHGLALAAETSIWRVAREARALARRGAARSPGSPLLGAHRDVLTLAGRGSTHPWVEAARGLPAAKRLQVEGLAYNLLACHECRRTRAVRLIHGPLLQPILEFCLRVPAHRLVRGGRDRALARQAFADRLPSAVVERRSKGDLTRVYGRELEAALPFVRERLLEGRLRSWGLLDAAVLEERLTSESLMWRGGYGDLMELLVIESWARAIGSSSSSR